MAFSLNAIRGAFSITAGERAPLLPRSSNNEPQSQPQLPPELAGLSERPAPARVPRPWLDAERKLLDNDDSVVRALFFKHDTQYQKYADDERYYLPNPHLARRTLEKLMWGGGRIALEGVAGLGLTYATAIMTQTFLSMFAGEDQNFLQSSVIDASVYLVNTRDGFVPPVISEKTAIGLMTLSAAVNYPKAMAATGGNNQGAQYAVASMFVARLTKALEDVFHLLKNMRPTRQDDIQKIFKEFYSKNRKIIVQMPDHRREVYNLVEGEIKRYWRSSDAAHNIGIDQLTNCRYLMETLEILVKSYENSLVIPRNNWYYDTGDITAAEALNKRIARLCEGVDDAGKKTVEKFATNHLMRRAGNWMPIEENKGAQNMNVLVLAGEAGTGKSFVSKALCTELESDEVTVMFSDVLRHLGGEEKKEQIPDKNASASVDPSPVLQFGTFRKLLYIKPGSIVRMEEVNLVGRAHSNAQGGVNFVPIDYDYLNSIKVKWEPNDGFGLFTVRGYPEGVLFIADMRRVSFSTTTNKIPNEPALNRRMGVAYCNKMPEPKRREIALDAARFCFTRVIPRFYEKSLTLEQIYAVKLDLASMMEFIVKEGSKDAGPQIMQMVILGRSHDLARQYAHGERTVGVIDVEEANPLDHPTETFYGPIWTESKLDPKEEMLILEHFKANRGLDRIDNLLQKAKKDLTERQEGEPLPDVKHYMKMAEADKKLSPKDIMKFTVMAVSQQWEPYLDKRPADIRNSVEALRKEVLAYLMYIRETEEGMHGWGFTEAQQYVELFDSIMRIPSTPQNLSYWEVGGNREKRKEMVDIRTRIQSRFTGAQNSGKNIVSFVQRTIDNTFPFPEELREAASRRCVLSLSGPLGTNPTEEAKRIIKEIGLHPIVMSLNQYLGLYEAGASRNSSRGDDERIKLNLETMLGQLKPLLQGEHYNCAIVIDDADFSDRNVAARAKQYLGPNAKNPKISFDEVSNVEFEIPLNELSVVVTSESRIEDPALKLLMWEERIEKIAEPDRQVTLQGVFNNELAKLKFIDIDLSEKEKIRDSVGKMMAFCLQLNMERDPGPEPAVRAVRKLFETLIERAKDAELYAPVKGKKADRATAADPSKMFSNFGLVWAPPVREDLPTDLVEIVENELKLFRAIQGGEPDESQAEDGKKEGGGEDQSASVASEDKGREVTADERVLKAMKLLSGMSHEQIEDAITKVTTAALKLRTEAAGGGKASQTEAAETQASS